MVTGVEEEPVFPEIVFPSLFSAFDHTWTHSSCADLQIKRRAGRTWLRLSRLSSGIHRDR
jgi:hypothetical protein